MNINYIAELKELFSKIEISNINGNPVPFDKAISKIINTVESNKKKGNKVIFIGNGGSASIASHLTTDFMKNAQIPAIAFNDSSLLTCLSNDLGYESVFEKPIEMLSTKGDILFSISSSGKSRNIVNATLEAKRKKCFVITLSGFNKNNRLRKLGNVNFYIPSYSYGYVEIIHLVICHLIVDSIKKC